MNVSATRGLAVITGAAGGLGSSFASQLAQRGYRLLLVDRRQKQLEQLCESVTASQGVSAQARVVDFCNRAEVHLLAEEIGQMEDVELLVNNAGFGTFEYFVDTESKYLVDMVDVHVVAPTILSRSVLPRMIEQNRGAIINVSSLSAWFQSACNVQYSSTKSYLAVFSTALAEELRETKVRVQALCPGLIRTDFHAADSMRGFQSRCVPAPQLWMSADEVVDCSLRRLSSKQVIVIPGVGYPILGRLAQMPLLQPLMQWLFRAPRVAPAAIPQAQACPAVAFETANESSIAP